MYTTLFGWGSYSESSDAEDDPSLNTTGLDIGKKRWDA